MRRKITGMIAMVLCICGLWTDGLKVQAAIAPVEAESLTGMRAAISTVEVVDSPTETQATTTPPEDQTGVFSGTVKLLKQENSNCVMQVTVENVGEDFSGTVQVIFLGTSDGNCAYNTEITLPAQGRKQFTITVPEQAINMVRGMCALNFLDETGKMVQSVSLNNIFGNSTTGISVGILSDDFSSLGYLDAKGRNLDFSNGMYPLKLVELRQENLRGYLDGLYFLVIDRFNVSTLDEEDIQAIQDWVISGGWLIIGTGAYAEQTLSGFGENFLDVEISGISKPGETNRISTNAEKYGDYYNYRDEGIDFSQMAVADLKCNMDMFSENPEIPGIFAPVGDGAVSIMFFSLGEADMQNLPVYEIQNLYLITMYNSNSYYQHNNNSDTEWASRKALAYIDNSNTNVDFTWLEILIGVYVILVGPALYLVLRRGKKSEWYWVCAPLLGILFIGGVFFFGRSAKVNEMKAYTVTTQRGGSNWADTYFLAYQSGIKEWNLHLPKDYEVAGPGLNSYFNSYNTNISDYYYVVNNGSEGLSVGIKPRENFDSGFLYAGKKAEDKGKFSGADVWVSAVNGTAKGTIKNDTICDMAYMTVWFDSYIMVFRDVKAGETLDLAQAIQDGRCVYSDKMAKHDILLYNMVGVYSRLSNISYEQDDMAALLIGMGVAEKSRPVEENYAVVVGLIKDYDKVVTSKCSEISYGCIYSYVEGEVEESAQN